MPLPELINNIINQNNNNPSKEILASSGIYDKIRYANQIYFADRPGQLVPNTGIVLTTPPPGAPDPRVPTAYAPHLNHTFRITVPNRQFPRALLNGGNFFIDDMLVFNKYIHYDDKGPVKTFDPQSFLQESVVRFNAYSLEFR
jgi:hypothetical protein